MRPLSPRAEHGGKHAGEVRLVTAVFADVSGFTALSHQLDPEALAELVDPLLATLGDVVGRHGGTVEMHAGDALLAIFGAPRSHDDDAMRAVRAALEMLRRVAGDDGGLAVHVGVNTGRVIAREYGSGSRVDYGVLGSAVVLAQRLMSVAPAGEIYISESTWRLVARAVECEAVDPLRLKGIEERTPAWRVLGLRETIEEPVAPLVGRTREVERIEAVLDGLRAGRGGAVLVTGEPGIGKSRLAAEIRRRAGDLTWLQARGAAHDRDVAYAPYAGLLRRTAHRDDPYLAALAGAPDASVAGLEPEMFRHELHGAFLAWLDELAATRPVVLELEDVHWFDQPSVILTRDLLGSVGERRIVLQLAAREVPRALRSPGASFVALELEPLEREQLAALIGPLLGGGAPPPDLADTILARTGGNPYFAAELVRALVDTAAADGTAGIVIDVEAVAALLPVTVEGVLSSRIDLLPDAVGSVLLMAAVMGPEVSVPLLRAVADGVDDAVEQLLDRRILRRLDDETLAFHHVLMREVAYGRLPRRRRREVHGQVAHAAEQLFGRADEAVELLARHAYLAESGLEAVEHLRRSAERAQRLHANDEAIAELRRAVERAGDMPEGDERTAVEADLQLRLGRVLELVGRYDEAAAAFEGSAERLRDPVARAVPLAALGTSLWRADRYERASRVFADALGDLAEGGGGDAATWARAWLDVADARFVLLYWHNDIAGMEALIERMRPRVELAASPPQRLRFLNSQWLLAIRRDRYHPSSETLDAARAELALGLELGDEARHFSVGFCHLWRREFAEAEHHLTTTLAVAERTGARRLRTRTLSYLAVLHRLCGDIPRVQETLALVPEYDSALYTAMASANRAWIAWRQGDRDAAAAEGERALRGWRQTGNVGPATMFHWTAHWPLLAVALADGRSTAARAHAHALLDPDAQPPPPEIVAALQAGELEDALRLAAPYGYV